MNPEIELVPVVTHLTEEQFGEVMAASARRGDRALTAAELHVLACEQCAAELDKLRESLALFRAAATSYAANELRNVPPVPIPARPMVSPALRSAALAMAATLAIAAFLPVQILHERSVQTAQRRAANASAATGFQHYARESDEALLEDVDEAASASVPDAMQSLADPAATTDLSVRKSN